MLTDPKHGNVAWLLDCQHNIEECVVFGTPYSKCSQPTFVRIKSTNVETDFLQLNRDLFSTYEEANHERIYRAKAKIEEIQNQIVKWSVTDDQPNDVQFSITCCESM